MTLKSIFWLALVLLSVQGARGAEPSVDDYKAGVRKCMQSRDFDCAEKNWQQLVRLRPNDGNFRASLGIVMTLRDNHKGAIAQFERAIELGEGTYDLFSYYADSLAGVGRTEEAIDWSYKALTVVPNLVDVRGKLAKLLVLQKRHFEALSVLGAFDDSQARIGKGSYFEAQRISIETAWAKIQDAPQTEAKPMRLPAFQGHFFAPVSLGSGRSATFLVDTGASRLTMGSELLAQSRASYKVTNPSVLMKAADGRAVNGKMVSITSVKVGPYEIKDVQAFVCQTCSALLGQSVLTKFDTSSAKVQGVEFLNLMPRR